MEPIIHAAAAGLAGLTGWSEPVALLVLLGAVAAVLLVLLLLVLRALFRKRLPEAAADATEASIERLRELGEGFADNEAREAAVFIAKVSRNLSAKGNQRRGAGLLLGAYLPLALRAATALRQIEAGGRDGKQAVEALKDIAIAYYDQLQGKAPPDPQPMEARVALAEVQALKAWDGSTAVPEPDKLIARRPA